MKPRKTLLEHNASFDVKCHEPSLYCTYYFPCPEQSGGDVIYASEKLGEAGPIPSSARIRFLQSDFILP